MVREPLTLIFVFVFPVVTMLIIGGSFGTTPTVAFDWVNPSQWYVASYLTVVIAATGLIMVPVHLASYRERGVLRRFAAAGFPRWSFALAEVVTGLVAIIVGSVTLLAVAAPVYGLPSAHHLVRVALGFGLRSVAFVAIGVLLGTVLPSARSAQAVGMVLFFPSFLLGSGGPPPHVMGRRCGPSPATSRSPGSPSGARPMARDRHRHRLPPRRRGSRCCRHSACGTLLELSCREPVAPLTPTPCPGRLSP